jgi:5-formyltetrahydrofolate cyclo-ligase
MGVVTDHPQPTEAKAAVRARLRSKRRSDVPHRDRAEDGRALALDGLRVAREAGLRRGSWVAAYESTPTEPPTEALVAALAARGIRVMLPVTLADWDLDWREVGSDVQLGPQAIEQAEVVFVPAHAVDPAGNRIGQGKGCYDRALARATGLVVAVVHPWEVLDEPLPHDAHDRPVDAVMAAGVGVRHLKP